VEPTRSSNVSDLLELIDLKADVLVWTRLLPTLSSTSCSWLQAHEEVRPEPRGKLRFVLL
jgi:hypothetical protein